MAYNPLSPISFDYSPNNTNPLPQTVVYDAPNSDIFDINLISIINLPPWLEAVNVFQNLLGINFTLRIKQSYIASMVSGNYTADINIRYRENFTTWKISPNYTIDLSLNLAPTLALNPTTLPFTYIIGGSVPQNQTLSIVSANNWTIVASQAWVNLSQSTGVNSGQVFIGVDPSGLTVGQYSAILTVTDAQLQRQATVTLNITEGDTDTDFFYVGPQNVQFVSELGVANSSSKGLTIFCSGSWTAQTSDSWITLSANSGGQGATIIQLSVDSVALPLLESQYLGQITFSQGDLQKTVFVELFIIEFFTQGIESETLYFSDDRNRFRVSDNAPGIFLFLEGIINNGTQNQFYRLSAPFQNGLASVLFGMETNVMLKSVIPTNNLSTRVKNNISPVTINFDSYSKKLNSGIITNKNQFSNVRFLTGKHPKGRSTVSEQKKLSYIPNTVHLTKNAVLSISALSDFDLSAINEIVVTGDVTATFSTSIADNLYVYNAILNLADLNLEVGNAIRVAYSNFLVNVVIKKEGLEQNILAFENEWREHEFFECTGKLEIEDTAEAIETELQVDGTKQTKVVSIDMGKTYTLNTGQIYSEKEIEWLGMALRSKRVFIYKNNTPIEIIMTTKSLKTYETRKAYSSFKLKFKKAIIE